MKTALLISGLQTVSFLLLTVNFRAIAKGYLVTAVATDALIAGVGFLLIRLIADARTTAVYMIAYVIGACAGSASGMWLTRNWRESE